MESEFRFRRLLLFQEEVLSGFAHETKLRADIMLFIPLFQDRFIRLIGVIIQVNGLPDAALEFRGRNT